MKMRDYVDNIQGKGAWDQMHNLIKEKRTDGWSMPPVEVDGRTVNIFPGDNREITLEAVQNEIRKCFAQAGDRHIPAVVIPNEI